MPARKFCVFPPKGEFASINVASGGLDGGTITKTGTYVLKTDYMILQYTLVSTANTNYTSEACVYELENSDDTLILYESNSKLLFNKE